jgi:hypothetical protein
MRPETEIAAGDLEMEVAKDTVVIDSSNTIAQLQGAENPTKFRNLVHQVAGISISSAQAANFLELFGDQLTAELTDARRKFIERHFGNKNQNR